jgi:uncharacterized protein (DUF1330 family)
VPLLDRLDILHPEARMPRRGMSAVRQLPTSRLGGGSFRRRGKHRTLAVRTGRQRKMPAYWVARSKINDPVEYKKYTDLVPAIIAKYGGKVLARGGRYQILEGPQKFHRFVVIEFPTFEQGVACFQSEEYNRAAAFRRGGAGEVETIMVEGGDATPR